MNKIKEFLIIHKIKVSIGVIVGMLFVVGIYFLMVPDKVYLILNSEAKEGMSIEYGTTIDIEADKYLDFKELSKQEKEELLKTAKVTTTVKNEEGKEYPGIGTYTIEITYNKEKVNVKVEVKDTVAPELTTLQYVECILGTEFDFSKYTKATDLATTDISYDTTTLNKDAVGEYIVKVVAKDASNNSVEKEMTVVIKDKPTDQQIVTAIEDVENGKITLEIKNKPIVQKPQETKPQTTTPKPTTPTDKPKGEVIELSAPYINQYAYGAPMGCEGASLLQALQAKGYAGGVGLKTILDTMPYTSDGNPHHGFVSSPYIVDDAMVYQSIFPSALTPFGNNYGTCINTSGSSAGQLVEHLKAGNPSVVYVTYKFAYPK